MAMLFYFSDAELFSNLSIGIVFLLVILTSPVLIPYWMFRNPDKRTKELAIIRRFSKWLTLICTVVLIITFCSARWNPASRNFETIIFLLMIIPAAFAFIFGLISLPRWQGFVGIVCFICYCTYFMSL